VKILPEEPAEVKMVTKRADIPYRMDTPEEILAKRGTLGDTIRALNIWRDYYERIIRGEAADWQYPITPEEAIEKIGPVENVIKTLWTILYPPEFKVGLTKTRDKLRENRDKCIAGECTKEAALALFNQTWLDFKNDTYFHFCIFLRELSGQQAGPETREIENAETLPNEQTWLEIWRITENAATDIINVIRAEIEAAHPVFLTDEDCLNRLADTGFIMINQRIKDRTVYLKKKATMFWMFLTNW
jgi:hypothetical protein